MRVKIYVVVLSPYGMPILAAVAGTRSEDPVVSVGYDLATAYGDDLIVLNVVPEEEFEAHREEIQRIDEFRDYSFTQEEESAATISERVVDTTLAAYEPETVETVGRIGSPDEEILTVASTVDATYIVVGGRKRSPVGKALFGSTTQAVLLNADRPVVTVMQERE